MKTNNLTRNDFIYITLASLVLGAVMSSIQPGNWIIGFASFSFLFLLSFSLFSFSLRWAGAGRTLVYILYLAFFLRLIVGVTLHLGLPVFGHEDEDDRAGYVFTDAHKRDDQAWKLASSEHPVIDAFSKKYSSDQYGGLLAFNSWVYRYLSPDAQRPLVLILFSAFFAALGVPFLWKAVSRVFGENIAWASTWIFALYPESVLLGASAMREPYLLTFSAFALWGFVNFGVQELIAPQGYAPVLDSKLSDSKRSAYIWLGLGLLGMMLVSTPAALITIVILAGWLFFANEKRQISWTTIAIVAVVFVLGLFLLSASLNRSGEFNATSPLHVINDWLKLAVKWDAYQLERGSGWVQKLFDEMPEWMRLPFVAIYGIFQPVLPATFIHPTPTIWKVLGILRALGWYALLPMLILSFGAAAGQRSSKMHADDRREGRSIILWLSLLAWIWILLAALRGGGDLWDNPRYRTILFLWQAVLAGYVWVWWRETRNVWFERILACELVFVLIFTQWYMSRYIKLGFQLPFAVMITLILGLWAIILGIGWWRDKQRA